MSLKIAENIVHKSANPANKEKSRTIHSRVLSNERTINEQILYFSVSVLLLVSYTFNSEITSFNLDYINSLTSVFETALDK